MVIFTLLARRADYLTNWKTLLKWLIAEANTLEEKTGAAQVC